ncbi:MAG TPA: nucleotidyltransferase domain-containing protein [Kofleriaceae bacterium]|nr:nucleotidyltransferase domain-containing protein [Kofleriaceae bacterium]
MDRLAGERRIPQGAMGRVVRIEGEDVRVAIVGVGEASYARGEVMPRKAGQLRFARQREAAWEALHRCVVLETVVGSRAWGLADDASDTDRRGVFVLPFSWTTGLVPVPDDLLSADGSAMFWEAGKAVRQGLRADPNTLEVFFAPDVAVRDEMGAWLWEARDAFVSQEIYGSFGRYALSQAKKLRQSLRLAEHRSLLLEWLRAAPATSLDEAAVRLADATGIEAPTEADRLLRAKEYIKQLYRSLHDQALVAEANFDAFVRFAQEGAEAFELPRELRPKNAYNLLRLIGTAIAWLRTGSVDLRVAEPLRSRLVAIKRGEVPLATVLDEADELAAELEDARRDSRLPARGDVGRADHVLRRIREEAARRWGERAAGPFGAGAPELVEAQWQD